MSNPETPYGGDPSATPPPVLDADATVSIPAMPLPPPPGSDPSPFGATPPPPPPPGTPPLGADPFGAAPPPPPGGGFGGGPVDPTYGAPTYPPPASYPPPGPYQPAAAYGAVPYAGIQAQPKTGLAVGALICGILGLVISLVPFVGYGGSMLGLVAIVLGFLGLSAAKRQGGAGRGMAFGGIATGVLSILVSIAWTLLIVLATDEVNDNINTDPVDGVCNPERILEDPDC